MKATESISQTTDRRWTHVSLERDGILAGEVGGLIVIDNGPDDMITLPVAEVGQLIEDLNEIMLTAGTVGQVINTADHLGVQASDLWRRKYAHLLRDND